MKKKILGYSIYNENIGFTCELMTKSTSLWKNVPSTGILVNALNSITVFPNRAAAKAAVLSSLIYFGQRPSRFRDEPNKYFLQRVYSPQAS